MRFERNARVKYGFASVTRINQLWSLPVRRFRIRWPIIATVSALSTIALAVNQTVDTQIVLRFHSNITIVRVIAGSIPLLGMARGSIGHLFSEHFSFSHYQLVAQAIHIPVNWARRRRSAIWLRHFQCVHVDVIPLNAIKYQKNSSQQPPNRTLLGYRNAKFFRFSCAITFTHNLLATNLLTNSFTPSTATIHKQCALFANKFRKFFNNINSKSLVFVIANCLQRHKIRHIEFLLCVRVVNFVSFRFY